MAKGEYIGEYNDPTLLHGRRLIGSVVTMRVNAKTGKIESIERIKNPVDIELTAKEVRPLDNLLITDKKSDNIEG